MKEIRQEKNSPVSDNINTTKKIYHGPKLEKYGTVTAMTQAVTPTGMGDGASMGATKVS